MTAPRAAVRPGPAPAAAPLAVRPSAAPAAVRPGAAPAAVRPLAVHPLAIRPSAARVAAAICLAAAVAGPAAPAAAWGEATAGGPRAAIYGTPRLPLAFDHARHAAAGMTCADCHAVAASARPADRNLPTEASCFACHDVAAPDRPPRSSCDTCHPGYFPARPPGAAPTDTARAVPPPPPVEWPTAALVFSHRAHLGRGTPCEACHGDMAGAPSGAAGHLPGMDACLACHDGRTAPAACPTCHLATPDGRLVTSLPGGRLRPRGLFRADDHGADFSSAHGPAARADAAYCRNCHTESQCGDCHTGRVKPLSLHAADYVLSHPAAARRNDPDCTRCHRLQSDCLDCHLRSGVTMVTVPGFGFRDAANAGAARFHPPGFAGVGDRPGPGHHRYEARRNLRQCVSCHRESDCTPCHAAPDRGGLGLSPHPADFARRCGPALAANDRPCRRCHADRAALEARCE